MPQRSAQERPLCVSEPAQDGTVQLCNCAHTHYPQRGHFPETIMTGLKEVRFLLAQGKDWLDSERIDRETAI